MIHLTKKSKNFFLYYISMDNIRSIEVEKDALIYNSDMGAYYKLPYENGKRVLALRQYTKFITKRVNKDMKPYWAYDDDKGEVLVKFV